MPPLFISLYSKYKDKLSNNELALLTELSRHSNDISKKTIAEMADQLFVSSSTLYRLIRKLDFDSYSSFKYKVKESDKNIEIKDLLPKDRLNLTVRELEQTYSINQENINKAAKMFLQAKNRFVYGTGWKQKQIVKNFSTDLLLFGQTSIGLRDKVDLAKTVRSMGSEDIIIFNSLSGSINNYESTIDEIKLRGIPLISVTNDNHNPLSMVSDLSLFFVDREVSIPNINWSALPMIFLFELFIQAIVNESKQ